VKAHSGEHTGTFTLLERSQAICKETARFSHGFWWGGGRCFSAALGGERAISDTNRCGLKSPTVCGGNCSSKAETFAGMAGDFYCCLGCTRPWCREILPLLFSICIKLNKIRPNK